LSNGLVLTHCKRGTFLAFEHDRTIGRSLIDLGESCEAQAEFFDSFIKPGWVVVEVGANIGTHTVPIARRASIVYAFEPQRRVYNVLCGNLALNGIDNVETFRVAGGEKRERREVPVLDFDVENSPGSWGLSSEGNTAENVMDYVDIVPINIGCDFMKIDVEGWEIEVLKGSRPLIDKHKPALYVESDRREKHNELLNYIKSMGYKAYWHVTPLYREENFRGVKEHYLKDYISQDMLCLPKEIPFDWLSEVTEE